MNMHDRGSVDGRWSKEAIERLWREHRPWVAALLYAHLPGGSRSTIDINDLLQEVAMSLVKNVYQLNSPERIGPWLRTVAMNIARDAGRRCAVRKSTRHAGDDLDELTAPRAREIGSGRQDGRERGLQALEIATSLPPEYREPLLLSLRGLSHKQIALVCELPVSTVETRVFRARVMVRKEMEAMERRPQTTESNEMPSGKRLKVSSES